MGSKALVVGLTPEYYSTTVSSAVGSYGSTMRSTNMGASFITRSIMSIFDSDYVDFTSLDKVEDLRNRYDLCLVSLASHLSPSRDVGSLVKFLKRLDIRTVFLSGGLDAGAAARVDQSVSKSVRGLLEICSADNQWIGVRGAMSAFYLHRHGVESVVPIGCPTMYSKPPARVVCPGTETKIEIAVPFHWTIAASMFEKLKGHYLIGQDCSDEELFVEKRRSPVTRKVCECLGVSRHEAFRVLTEAIDENGYFPNSYADWYEVIGRQTALVSGRLHATICGLTQGVPSVLVPWDLRAQELVDYFALPNVSGSMVQKKGLRESLVGADFDGYNSRQPLFWERWHEFLEDNKLAGYLSDDAPENREKRDSRGALECGHSLLSTAAVPWRLPNISTSRAFANSVCRAPGMLKRLLAMLEAPGNNILTLLRRVNESWNR